MSGNIFEIVKNDEKVKAYIKAGDDALKVLGFTEHSFTHVHKTAQNGADILVNLGYGGRDTELAKIAGLLHDIGNMVNRTNHAMSGAVLAECLLSRFDGLTYSEIASVVSAIGNHDEETGRPVNIIAAAVILADKSDVRRSRVYETEMDKILADIHDRVNYAVTNNSISADIIDGRKKIVLNLDIDTSVCTVMDYFEIFLSRMLMCRRAAAYLDAEFDLIINNLKIM